MNTVRRCAALLACCLFAVAGPCAAPARDAAASDPIAALLQAFVVDLERKDVDGSVSLFTPNAVFVDPDGHEFRGTSSIRRLYATVAASFDSDITLVRTRRTRAAAVAREEGTYRERLRMRKTGAVQNVRGGYRFTFTRGAGGRWRIAGLQWTVEAEKSPRRDGLSNTTVLALVRIL